MNNPEPDTRNGVRALIVRDGRVLLQHKQSSDYGHRYTLPGGTQESGETLEATLVRECEEEIGATVRVLELVHVADFFKPRGTQPESHRHLVEFFFACQVSDDYQASNGPRPDRHQKDITWVPLDQIGGLPLFPTRLKSILEGEYATAKQTYLGLIE